MECPCGSKRKSWQLYDARGIYVARVCASCIRIVKSKYRPEIFLDPDYKTNEKIEEED